MLTGIHTGNYGVDLDSNFADLLTKIVKIKGLKRLRISSIEITELTQDVLNVIKDNDIIVDHMHIPLQAGSDEILKLMNRKYDMNYYFDKIKEIRTIRPEISVSTDIIVGFPGETEELFEKTIENAKKLAFTKIHVFPYSERKGTVAVTLPNSVPVPERKQRARKLLETSKELEIDYMKKYINKEVEVLVEETKNGYSLGHTGNFLHVKINRELPTNQFIKVTIKEIDYPYCIAE